MNIGNIGNIGEEVERILELGKLRKTLTEEEYKRVLTEEELLDYLQSKRMKSEDPRVVNFKCPRCEEKIKPITNFHYLPTWLGVIKKQSLKCPLCGEEFDAEEKLRQSEHRMRNYVMDEINELRLSDFISNEEAERRINELK